MNGPSLSETIRSTHAVTLRDCDLATWARMADEQECETERAEMEAAVARGECRFAWTMHREMEVSRDQWRAFSLLTLAASLIVVFLAWVWL